MALPLITDPTFYAVAVPAVLLLGLSKAGFGAGVGSLAVPMMALVVSVPQAAAILMPVLLLMDLMGVTVFRREVDWPLLRFLVPFGLLGTAVGTLLFHVLDARWVAGLVGGLTLLFLAQRLLFPPRADSRPWPRPVGALMTVAAGFTSFVAHAGGPPVTAYVIPMRLSPVRFTATMAVFFFVVNASKWLPYAWLGLLDARNLATSLVLLPVAPVGVLAGAWLTRRIDAHWFYRLVYAGMALTGLKLLWDAVAG